jgi:hypothetical protein
MDSIARTQRTPPVWNSGRLAPIIHLGLLNSGFRFPALCGMLPLLSTWPDDISDFDVSR